MLGRGENFHARVKGKGRIDEKISGVWGSALCWELTIAEKRRRIARLLRNNLSLRSYLFAAFVDAYEDAGFTVVRETGLPQTTFPEVCPYTLDQVLDDPWLPE